MPARLRTRFAPSPTGYLHIGHARAAAAAFGWAEANGAECLLRIEDIDPTRCRADYTDAIFEDLRWLGFDWPNMPPHGPVRVQSEHRDDFAKVAEHLAGMGVIYPCDLSRTDVAALTEDGIFRGRAVPGPKAPWRLDVRAAREVTGPLAYTDNGERVEVDFNTVSDEIVVRRDTYVGEWGTSYFLACTHDDHLQGITHVVRGEDLREATPVQRILQALMGWEVPEYIHHPLVMEGERKLSKSDGDTAIRELRAAGLSPAEVLCRAS